MTADEAIAIVDEKAKGRTRYEDRHPLLGGSGTPNNFLDEVLVEEIKKLRQDYDELKETLSELLCHGDEGDYEDLMDDDSEDYEEWEAEDEIPCD